MELKYDEHGDVHFHGAPHKTRWVNNKNTVDPLIQTYLTAHQGDLDTLCQIYADGVQTSFYILDFMTALPLAGETQTVFVIQGGYKREKGVVTVNYHMYPTDDPILHFGIGTTNNAALTDANN